MTFFHRFSFAAAQVAVGLALIHTTAARAEFQVNTFTVGDQAQPRVAMDDAGNFVAVWHSEGQDGSGDGVYGQRFDASGTPLGTEFLVNSTTTGSQRAPSIAMNSVGDFVVTWQSGDGFAEGIFARQYNSSGVPLSPELQVNTRTTKRQLDPDVAIHDNGAFTVTWMSDLRPDDGSHLADWHILSRLFDSDGTGLSEELLVSQVLSGRNPRVAMDDTGDFVVTYDNIRGGRYFVKSRHYFANGTPKGNEVDLTGSMGSVGTPAIAMNGAGEYAIAWADNPSDSFLNDDIHVQSYAPDGTPVGAEFLANTTLDGFQRAQAVALNNPGQLLVTWDDFDLGDVFAQAYDRDRTPIGGEFQLNSVTSGNQWLPDVAMNDDGRYVAVWQSDGQDGDDWGIFARVGVIPEPTTSALSLVAMTALGLLRRRRP